MIPCFNSKNSFDFNFHNKDKDNNDYYNNDILFEDIKKISIEDPKKENIFSIENVEQYFDMKFRYNYNNNDINSDLLINIDEEKDILIKDNFLIAIINMDNLSDSEISTIVLNIIDKDLWSEIQ